MRVMGDYETYIFDMDGTLYFQTPLRIRMIKQMILFALFHPFRIWELLVIRDYRKLRETFEGDYSDEVIACELAKKYKKSIEQIRRVVADWIFKRPLTLLPLCADNTLLEFISDLQRKKKRIVVYSDYPVVDKLKTLGLSGEIVPVWPNGKDFSRLKPNPEGLSYIIKHYNVNIKKAIVIGDRHEKDGMAANSMGVDSLILKRSHAKRKKQYKELEWN